MISSVNSDPQPEASLFERTNTLKDRITTFNGEKSKSEITNLFSVNESAIARLKSEVQKQSASNLRITQVMTVAPPAQGNFSQIAASHLHWAEDQNQVYIGYIVSGPEYGGGFDVIDGNIECYRNNQSSCRSASFITNQFEVGAVATNSGFFYASGALNYESGNIINGIDMGSFSSPAAIFRTPIDDIDGSGRIDNADLASYSATDVKTYNGSVYAVTGSGTGRLYRLSEDLTIEESVEPSNGDLRSIALSNENLFMLNGAGEVHSTALNANAFNLTSIGDAGDGIRDFTIAKMSYSDNQGGRLYVPLNDGGFAVLDAASGEVITTVTDAYYSGISVHGNFVYAAASSDDGGLVQVFQWDRNDDQTLVNVGSINLDGVQANANILATSTHLFVANDENGVVVLQIAYPR